MLKNFSRSLRNAVLQRCTRPWIQELKRELTGVKSVLDVGCGPLSSIHQFKKELCFTSVGIDIFEQSVESSRAAGVHDKHYVMDARTIDTAFPPKSFDAVIAVDVIEHLTKEDGNKLLQKMELLARKKIIITTPNGFLEQHEHSGNPFQEHKSGWTIKEMRNHGFRCRGIIGLWFICGELGNILLSPKKLWSKIGKLSQPVVYYFPAIASSLLCVKEFFSERKK